MEIPQMIEMDFHGFPKILFLLNILHITEDDGVSLAAYVGISSKYCRRGKNTVENRRQRKREGLPRLATICILTGCMKIVKRRNKNVE